MKTIIKQVTILMLTLLFAVLLMGAVSAEIPSYNSGIQVQDIGTSQATITVTYYNKDGSISDPSISDNGHVAYTLTANGKKDIYHYDVNQETNELVSAGAGSNGGNGNSGSPVISSDGLFIVYESKATNLVPGLTTNGNQQIYRYNLNTKTTELVTTGPDGKGGNGYSYTPSINADGNLIVFTSSATNLGPESNGKSNVYLRNMNQGTTTLVTTGSSGKGGNDCSGTAVISGDGFFIAYDSYATDLIPNLITNGFEQVYLYNVNAKRTNLITTGRDGIGGDRPSFNPGIRSFKEATGFEAQFNIDVTYTSNAQNLVPGTNYNANENVFVCDLIMDENGYFVPDTELVTKGDTHEGGNSDSGHASISSDGKKVVFHSLATDLVIQNIGGFTNPTCNVFYYNTNTKTTKLLTKGTSGKGGDTDSYDPSISANGNYVVYITYDKITDDKIPPTVNDMPYDWFHSTSPSTDPNVRVTADASDNVGVTKVVFTTSNGQTGTDTQGADGWSFNWNPKNLATGDYKITATAYDAAGNTGTGQVTVQIPADVYAKLSFSSTSLIVGENVVVTFKIGNNGPGKGTDVVFTYRIPDGMEFVETRTDPVGQGTVKYDPASRTLTWTIGDVLVGDPYLYVTQTPLAAGTFSLGYGFNSATTLGLNTATMITSVMVNTPSHTNHQQNINAATTTTSSIRGAQNTISMQTTGLPIGTAILAVLIIIGALFNSKRGK